MFIFFYIVYSILLIEILLKSLFLGTSQIFDNIFKTDIEFRVQLLFELVIYKSSLRLWSLEDSRVFRYCFKHIRYDLEVFEYGVDFLKSILVE